MGGYAIPGPSSEGNRPVINGRVTPGGSPSPGAGLGGEPAPLAPWELRQQAMLQACANVAPNLRHEAQRLCRVSAPKLWNIQDNLSHRGEPLWWPIRA